MISRNDVTESTNLSRKNCKNL